MAESLAHEEITAGRSSVPVAIRVGALDGRHPELWQRAQASLVRALVAGGVLYMDGGHPLREIVLAEAQPGE